MAPVKTANRAKTSLKLMVHKGSKRVIFAEADGTFVDSLFSLMTLPMGTIVRLLEKCPDKKLKAIGSLKNLYQSLVDLPENYLSAEESRVLMLNPKSSAYDLCRKLKLNIDDTEPIKYYIYPISDPRQCFGVTFSASSFSRCEKCGHLMNREIKLKDSIANAAGDGVEDCVFVTDSTTYIVTDDLHVIPNTAGTGIQLLSDLGYTDAKHLEEMTFEVGIEQILLLLKGALLFKYSLTYMVYNSTYDHDLDQGFLKPRLRTLIQSLTSNEIVAASEKMKLKVHLQKSTSKLMFVEANEVFVDFVLGFLEIPLGTIIGKLMAGSSSVESLDNLYASILNMDVGCIKTHDLKELLLEPLLACRHVSKNNIFSLKVSNDPKFYLHNIYSQPTPFVSVKTLYLSQVRCNVSYKDGERCDLLKYKHPRKILKAPAAKFMITEDLVLAPSSSISTIAMLSKFNVSLDDVEEREVSIGFDEGLRILQASLTSATAFSEGLEYQLKSIYNTRKKKAELKVEPKRCRRI